MPSKVASDMIRVTNKFKNSGGADSRLSFKSTGALRISSYKKYRSGWLQRFHELAILLFI